MNPKDWKWLFDQLKNPTRVSFVLMVVLGLLLLAPPSALTWIGADQLAATHRGWIGIAFLCLSALWIVGLVVMVRDWTAQKVRSRARLKAARERILDATPGELLVLNSYRQSGERVLQVDNRLNPVVSLLRDGVLVHATSQPTLGTCAITGQRELVWSVQLSSTSWTLLQEDVLDAVVVDREASR